MSVVIADSHRTEEAQSEQLDRRVRALIDAWGQVQDLRTQGAPLPSLLRALVALDKARAALRPHREGGSPIDPDERDQPSRR